VDIEEALPFVLPTLALTIDTVCVVVLIMLLTAAHEPYSFFRLASCGVLLVLTFAYAGS
jgi:hypothetical protein